MTINYAKLLILFQQQKLEGRQYLLQIEIKYEVLKMLRHYTFEMLNNPNNNDYFYWESVDAPYDIDQIKLELHEFLNIPVARLTEKLRHLNCLDFIKDLNDLSQYDIFKEYDEDYEPFQKYCFTIAEFWIDELYEIQTSYFNALTKDSANLIATSYLESIYSPYTVLGRKRFDKKRDELFN